MHHRITYMYINFQHIRVSIDQSKPRYLITDRPNLRSIGQLDIKITAEINYFHRRQTDGLTDGQMDGNNR